MAVSAILLISLLALLAMNILRQRLVDQAPLLAILMDGQPMSLRDKGPVWMVYPYDAGEEFRTEQALSRSIWQLTTLDLGE